MKPTQSLAACIASVSKSLTKKPAPKPVPNKPSRKKDADQLGSSGGGSIQFNG